jgi:hypothetical protein
MTNIELQEAINQTFNACNSVLQEHTSGGVARGLALKHLEHLYSIQKMRSEQEHDTSLEEIEK